MYKQKFIIIISFFLLFIVFAQDTQSKTTYIGNVNFQISPTKNTYLESEPVLIEFEVNVENIILDRDPVLYINGDLDYYLTNSKGDTLKIRGGVWDFGGKKSNRKHFFYIWDLLPNYGVNEDFPHSNYLGYFRLLPDKYNFQAKLYISSNKIESHYFSNLIRFEVIEPTGEELDAHRKLIEIDSFTCNNPPPINDEERISKFNKICEKVQDFENQYPNSVYIPNVQREIFLHSFLNPNFQDTLYTYVYNHILKYPNDYGNLGALDYLYNQNKNNENDFLENIINLKNSNKGTVLEKLIDKFLRQLDEE